MGLADEWAEEFYGKQIEALKARIVELETVLRDATTQTPWRARVEAALARVRQDRKEGRSTSATDELESLLLDDANQADARRCHACDQVRPDVGELPDSLPLCAQCAKAHRMGYRCGEEAAAMWPLTNEVQVAVEDSVLFRQIKNRYISLGEHPEAARLDLLRLVEWARRDAAPRTEPAVVKDEWRTEAVDLLCAYRNSLLGGAPYIGEAREPLPQSVKRASVLARIGALVDAPRSGEPSPRRDEPRPGGGSRYTVAEQRGISTEVGDAEDNLENTLRIGRELVALRKAAEEARRYVEASEAHEAKDWGAFEAGDLSSVASEYTRLKEALAALGEGAA